MQKYQIEQVNLLKRRDQQEINEAVKRVRLADEDGRVCFWGLDLNGLDLSGLDLSEIDFSDSTFISTNLRGTKLKLARLSSCDLTGADCTGADLGRAWLDDARLDKTNFEDADLSHARLHDAVIKGATFKNADLEDASLEHGPYCLADFSGCNVEGANLVGTPAEPELWQAALLDHWNVAGEDERKQLLELARAAKLSRDPVRHTDESPFPTDVLLGPDAEDNANVDHFSLAWGLHLVSSKQVITFLSQH